MHQLHEPEHSPLRKARQGGGIRKSIGSMRSQLINQFFCESVVVALLAFVVAIGLVYLALPQFNQVADNGQRPQARNTLCPKAAKVYFSVGLD
jgi:hypothetical protein